MEKYHKAGWLFFVFKLGFSFYFVSGLEAMLLFPIIQAGLSIHRKQHFWLKLHSQHPKFSPDSLAGQQLHKGVDPLFKMSLQVGHSQQAVRSICKYQKTVLFRALEGTEY